MTSVLELPPRCARFVPAFALCGLTAIVLDLIRSDDTERMVENLLYKKASHTLPSFMIC